MAEIITVGRRGEIIIPQRIRNDLKMRPGTKLRITEKKRGILLESKNSKEKQFLFLLSEASLKKVWGNKYDERWDKVL
mgnify:CR=1 FL=1